MHRDDIVRGERIRQAIDIVLKTAFRGVGMMSYGRSPRAFYFPEEKQLNILGSKLKQMFRSDVSQEVIILILSLFISNTFRNKNDCLCSILQMVSHKNRELPMLHF